MMHRLSAFLALCIAAVVVTVGLSGCGGATQARLYEIGPTELGRSFERVHIRHSLVEDGVKQERRDAFEAELADELVERGFEVSDDPSDALEISYNAVSFQSGSTAGRLATAAAGFLSPVPVLGEVGSGEVALRVMFREPDGDRIAETVIQQQVSGVTASTSGTIRALAGAAAKFAAAKFGPEAVGGEPAGDREWTGALPLYRAVEGAWRFRVESPSGELVTGRMEWTLHHQGRAVISTTVVDGDAEQPDDAIATLFQLKTGRVVRWWLNPLTGAWQESSMRLSARPDGFVYRSEVGASVSEGYVRARIGEPTGSITVTRVTDGKTDVARHDLAELRPQFLGDRALGLDVDLSAR
jgi:hypothetical protein